jgi:hypothetical protein
MELWRSRKKFGHFYLILMPSFKILYIKATVSVYLSICLCEQWLEDSSSHCLFLVMPSVCLCGQCLEDSSSHCSFPMMSFSWSNQFGCQILCGGSGDHNAQEFLEEVQQQFRKKQQRSEMTTPARWKRPLDQAEHIARERQWRDNMTSRFSTLDIASSGT